MQEQLRISVVERDLFVASDMVYSIHSVLPSAVCKVYSSVAEARASHAPDEDPLLVLVSASVGGDLAILEEDARWLLQRKVVAFDFSNRVAHSDWVHLDKPFAENELKSAVLSLVTSGSKEGVGAQEVAR